MSFTTDLTDSEWEVITTIHPDNRQRRHSLRSVWNAIFYIVKTGCQWRMLPGEFPPWQTVYYYYRQWRDRGIIEEVHNALRQSVRRRAGRQESPSAAIADSQSVKSTHSGPDRGFDGGKNVKGRKRHLVVDTLGLVLAVIVTAANVQDKRGLALLLDRVRERFDRLEILFVDGGYDSQPLSERVRRVIGCLLQVVPRPSTQKGFQVLPKRWIVERTFSWFNSYRRLSKDYEYRTDTSETMVYLAMIRLMLKRLR
jgi:putative transposase